MPDALDERPVVGGEQDGGAAQVDVEEETDDLLREIVVEIPGRLVGDQDLGLIDQRARDGDPLLLSSRKLAGEARHAVRESDAAQRLEGDALLPAVIETQDTGQKGDVLEDRLPLDEAEVLEDHADRPAEKRDLAARDQGDVAPVDQDLAGARHVLAEDQLEQRRLAGPARAGDETELAARDLEVDAVERRLSGRKSLRNAEELDHVRSPPAA